MLKLYVFKFMFMLWICMCLSGCMPYVCECPRGQKSAVCPLKLELKVVWVPAVGCWELSLYPLEEQRILLTAEPSVCPEHLSLSEPWLPFPPLPVEWGTVTFISLSTGTFEDSPLWLESVFLKCYYPLLYNSLPRLNYHSKLESRIYLAVREIMRFYDI